MKNSTKLALTLLTLTALFILCGSVTEPVLLAVGMAGIISAIFVCFSISKGAVRTKTSWLYKEQEPYEYWLYLGFWAIVSLFMLAFYTLMIWDKHSNQ